MFTGEDLYRPLKTFQEEKEIEFNLQRIYHRRSVDFDERNDLTETIQVLEAELLTTRSGYHCQPR